MNFKRMMYVSTLAAGVGVAGLFGASTANANPGPPCNAPNAPACQQGPGNDWQNRGIDRGRQDHRPFNYNGQQVQPLPAGNGNGWGFWFLGQWIPL
ncbi:hypothetical protein [Mycobacterium sp. E740]|uniref:hypothetical protein n=1 Tax=Mycobacterium sp. E740 TaxID=1834149 RepID=UPI00080182AB|nr:hypothetical protein [Mycobacterium sp. E740]OBI74388.1 hypothetical protein A5663_05485 [Mycobacterium sp. E740]